MAWRGTMILEEVAVVEELARTMRQWGLTNFC